MITDDKVTEIFCIADDFCKVFDAQMAKIRLRQKKRFIPELRWQVYIVV